MKGLNYLFDGFEELSDVLAFHEEERALLPPIESGELVEGDWVLATVSVGDESVAVAACVKDRGNGVRLTFEDRDWDKLEHFAGTHGPPSVPPSLPPPPPEETITPQAQILIVDQDVDTQEVVSELLASAGYTVRCVTSAEQAYDELRRFTVDLILLENSLPGMSGIDFCERLRRDRRLKKLPVVFLSTASSSEQVVKAFAAGADDYVTKPFRVPELSARVMGLLRKPKPI